MIILMTGKRFTEYLMFMLIFLNVIQIVTATATIEIRLLKYDVKDGLLNTKRCCDTTATTNCPTNQCDPYFNLCLQDFSVLDGCPLGSETTDFTQNKDHITFGNLVGTTKNEFLFHVNEYKGFIPKINAYDEDKSEGEDDDERLDYLQYVYTTSADIGGTNKIYHYIQLRGQVSSLDIKVAVYCDKDYYGSTCDTHCLSDYQYYCSDSGQRLCKLASCGPEITTSKSDIISKVPTTATLKSSTLTAVEQTTPTSSFNKKTSTVATNDPSKILPTRDTAESSRMILLASTTSPTIVSTINSSISPYSTSLVQTSQQMSSDKNNDSSKVPIIAGSVSAVVAISGLSTMIFFLYRRFCRRSKIQDSSSLEDGQKKGTM